MSQKLEEIVEPLLKWYQENKRKLPWRADKNPYHVWISEIMLQQTRIEAVKEYYQRFMKSIPNIEELAIIPEEKLLKLWEGLGYYSRAKNLKKAAIMIKEQYQRKMPSSYSNLIELPGIGEYTAGAISSICFNEKVTAVDGNVLRVISRVIGSTKDVLLPETKKEIEKMLLEIMPESSGDFNESLMELGETICMPNGEPLCEKCPIRENCFAKKNNLTESIPVRMKKTKRSKEELTVFLLKTKEGKIAIEKRNTQGLLSGMYQYPNIHTHLTEKEIDAQLKKWHLKSQTIKYVKDTKHVFTHLDWNMKCYEINVEKENKEFLWITLEELCNQYALPTAFLKCFSLDKKS